MYDNKWIMNSTKDDCNSDESSPATLGLTNMAGKYSANPVKRRISHVGWV